MKNAILWILAVLITLLAAYYQRKTGPTYPKTITVTLNDSVYKLKLIRSLGLEERPEVKLNIKDTSVSAKLLFKRYRTDDEYSISEFRYKSYPVNSYLMNKVFKIDQESGLFAEIPKQKPAGKLQYYIEITDSKGTNTFLNDSPVIIRFKGTVPAYILTPHIILMFLAMLFSTLAGLMSIFRHPKYLRYSYWTLALLTIGGMILGPVVQKFAFGELWTGIPFGWDLTDNKTLIAWVFWIFAIVMNRVKKRPLLILLASFILLLVYSIPHSMFGSELDYASGQVTQGLIFILSVKFLKNS